MNSGIYCIKNIKNNRLYVGSSKDVYKRKRRHFQELKNNKHKNVILQNAYNKNSILDFEFNIIEFTEIDNLIIREQYYIDTLTPYYNINLIANSSLGVTRRQTTKDKIKAANLGLKHPKWRNIIKSKSQGGKNHWTKKKDVPFSIESRNKMSNTHKRLYEQGYISPVAIPIIQYDLEMNPIKEWKSATEAANILGLTRSAINNCVNGKSKTSNKFIWKIKN